MKILEETFTLIHIRISHKKVLFMSLRHFVTLVFILLIAFSAFQIYKAAISEIDIINFIESAFYTILLIYSAFFWIKSWPKANRMLNKASEYESERKDKSDKDSI